MQFCINCFVLEQNAFAILSGNFFAYLKALLGSQGILLFVCIFT